MDVWKQIEELQAQESDDGFITESDHSSSDSDPSELALQEKFKTEDDDEDDDDELDRFYNLNDETLLDRIQALRDIISPTTRANVYQKLNWIYDSTRSTTKRLGNFAWVITTSMILVGLPMALSIEGESMLVAHEKEMERQSQGQQVRSSFQERSQFSSMFFLVF